ncbi:hypothetical protein PtrSN002B_011245 [Pyrenophora tritici-repentis]|uniref:Uncharacterized protein n=2 Tax=Pyrenophora tritici-repentis TaxID=45151 RepID=A0A2W1DSA7_9PLEO|nr:uncharacterized protein PTRG_12086 [Pyrenophora tritici-repentis Pt-1C-BFP]KAA8611303.1 hypothetical protein PtrV1_13964 [Pyrenophora tritici-repentis]EDU46234.1 predicted protein [Pyrenophora tritici-repentis Pt-1C-BFP]KAF7442101.1 hypothetical protein A1F99_129700 [Pyrenophora tritici-repentis]KAF7579536.1 hypothetical protein PtrM4_037760 [Pyrenophora tritici-repentis]KAG9378440.1 hypothetical protein A1F94_011556 [Pyrenophora tritici-repentis]
MRFSLLVPAVVLALGDGALAIYGCICRDQAYGPDARWTQSNCDRLRGTWDSDITGRNQFFYGMAPYQCKFDRADIDPATWDTYCRAGNQGRGNVQNSGGFVGTWSGLCNTAANR